MRVGVVTYWFNRGQGTIGRHLRAAFDELGHQTFVLARPTAESFARGSFVEQDDVWAQPGLEVASGFSIGTDEYVDWARRHRLDTVWCFQNYQFDAIEALRRTGVRTVGTFMWEDFGTQHGEAAKRAYDTIYALTESSVEHFRVCGLEPVRVRWGCHPETIEDRAPRASGGPRFLFPAGVLSRRRPLVDVVEAFRSGAPEDATLVVKCQLIPGVTARSGDHLRARVAAVQHAARGIGRRAEWIVRHRGARPPFASTAQEVVELVQSDDRVRLILGDLPHEEHRALSSAADVILAPSRWEGIGLHLFEAIGAAQPVITNAAPPMDELIAHDRNGLLVASRVTGTTPGGTPIVDVERAALVAAIADLAEPATQARLSAGARERRSELSWTTTVADLSAVLDGDAPER